MDVVLTEWLSVMLRWLHVIAGIAWIGSSFYFIHLDLSLKPNQALPGGVKVGVDVGAPERRREVPQIERRQFERPNPAPSARPPFAPRSEEPRRGGQVPPRQIINQGNPGGGEDH